LTFDWSNIDFLSYFENPVALSHISKLHTLLRKLYTCIAWVKFTIENFLSAGKFLCLLTLNSLNYIFVYFWNAIWLFYQLFIHAYSEPNVRNFFFLYISLCFLACSVKRSNGQVLASGRARLCRSLIWQHDVQTSMYHIQTRAFCFPCQTHTHYFLLVLSCCVVCVFSRTDPEIFAFSAHLFSFPGISFNFPYSLKLWFFLEYWNL
jgi:hypothetical protein